MMYLTHSTYLFTLHIYSSQLCMLLYVFILCSKELATSFLKAHLLSEEYIESLSACITCIKARYFPANTEDYRVWCDSPDDNCRYKVDKDCYFELKSVGPLGVLEDRHYFRHHQNRQHQQQLEQQQQQKNEIMLEREHSSDLHIVAPLIDRELFPTYRGQREGGEEGVCLMVDSGSCDDQVSCEAWGEVEEISPAPSPPKFPIPASLPLYRPPPLPKTTLKVHCIARLQRPSPMHSTVTTTCSEEYPHQSQPQSQPRHLRHTAEMPDSLSISTQKPIQDVRNYSYANLNSLVKAAKTDKTDSVTDKTDSVTDSVMQDRHDPVNAEQFQQFQSSDREHVCTHSVPTPFAIDHDAIDHDAVDHGAQQRSNFASHSAYSSYSPYSPTAAAAPMLTPALALVSDVSPMLPSTSDLTSWTQVA